MLKIPDQVRNDRQGTFYEAIVSSTRKKMNDEKINHPDMLKSIGFIAQGWLELFEMHDWMIVREDKLPTGR